MFEFIRIVLITLVVVMTICLCSLDIRLTNLQEQDRLQQTEIMRLEHTIDIYNNSIANLDGYIERLEQTNEIYQTEMKSLDNEIKHKDSRIYSLRENIVYMKDQNKPVPLQIAENMHKESDYLLDEWDCSDMTNEWVRRMRQQGYEANYTVGMLLLEDGSYGCHAWGTYTQHIELTNPRYIEGKEIGSKYIRTPSRQEVECEVCCE